jgi:hypothetical protein
MLNILSNLLCFICFFAKAIAFQRISRKVRAFNGRGISRAFTKARTFRRMKILSSFLLTINFMDMGLFNAP